MKFLQGLKVSKAMLAVMLVGIMISMTMVVAFAADGGEPFSIDYSSIFSEEMFTPLLEGIMSNVWVILPVCFGLLAIFWGPRLIQIILLHFFRIGVYVDADGKTVWYKADWDDEW